MLFAMSTVTPPLRAVEEWIDQGERFLFEPSLVSTTGR